MAKKIERLSALAVSKASKPGLYPDGAGLYLRVGRGGAKSWALRFMLNGKAREMGFGGLTKVSLADARKRAIDARLLLSEGKDPLDYRQDERTQRIAAEKLAAARTTTFEDCAKSYIEAQLRAKAWRNEKHAKQWETTLQSYVYGVLGMVPVQDITRSLVIKVLEPIWTTKAATARRVRGRIEIILNWAIARGERGEGNNPALRGPLLMGLPKQSKATRHHAALPYDQIAAFMKDLRATEGTSAAAFEFLILTAARTGEVISTRWSEIDLKQSVWTVPAARMKGGREHRVPLSPSAIAVLDRMRGERADYVFPGRNPGGPLSNMAFLMMLGRMDRGDITAHGFRSTFRDWAAEQTSFAREVGEAALAHAVDDKVEAAYRRGDLFDKRRKLMDAWALYCLAPKGGTVVAFRQ
jgi:integrase